MKKVIKAADIKSVKAIKRGEGRVDVAVEVEAERVKELGETLTDKRLIHGDSVVVGAETSVEGERHLVNALKTLRMRNVGKDGVSPVASKMVKDAVTAKAAGKEVSDKRFGAIRFGTNVELARAPDAHGLRRMKPVDGQTDIFDGEEKRKKAILRRALGLPRKKRITYDRMVRMARKLSEQDLIETIEGVAETMADRKPASVILDSDDRHSINPKPGENPYILRKDVAEKKQRQQTQMMYRMAVDGILDDVGITRYH